jgi:hypothetical protein
MALIGGFFKGKVNAGDALNFEKRISGTSLSLYPWQTD